MLFADDDVLLFFGDDDYDNNDGVAFVEGAGQGESPLDGGLLRRQRTWLQRRGR